jgi:hypothetical protein
LVVRRRRKTKVGSTSLSLRLCFASKSTDSYASVELQSVSMSLRCCMGDIEAFDRRTRGGVPSTEFHVARSRSPFIPLIQKKAAAAPTRFYSSDARSKYLADATRYHFLPSAQKASPKRSRQSARARHSMRATIRIEMERKENLAAKSLPSFRCFSLLVGGACFS